MSAANGCRRAEVQHLVRQGGVEPLSQPWQGRLIHRKIGGKVLKQKFVTKSSTEADLVGISDALGYAILARNWMIAQCHKEKHANLFQDNLSTIILAHKGQTSAERTRHINIRYFFIKDRIENGEVIVKYLSTDEMIADGLSKPLQGNKFKKSRRDLMNEKR